MNIRRVFAASLIAGGILQAQPGPRPAAPPPPQGARGNGGGRPGPPSPRATQSEPQYKTEDLCTVEGTVRNAQTGEPLAKANVMLMANGRSRQMMAATTAADGKFVIQGVEPGQYRLSAGRNGFVDSARSGRRAVLPSSTLTLAKSQTIKNIDAKLIPHAVITGRVTDADGEPLANATVQLKRYRFTQQGRRELADAQSGPTNDLGEYRLFGLPPGKYVIAVDAGGRAQFQRQADPPAGVEGLVTTFYPGSMDAAQSTPVDIATGSVLQGIDIRMMTARTYRVSGQVAGMPAGRRDGGMVMILPANTSEFNIGSRMMNAPWQPDGKFTLRGLRPGSYVVSAQVFGNEGRLMGTAALEVGDRNVDNVQIVMQPAFDVAGSIRLEGQGTMAFENVTLIPQPRESARTGFGGMGGARPGEDGHFVIKQALAGHYDLALAGLPDNHYVKSISAGQIDALTDGMRLMPGMQVDVVVSPAGGRIDGAVLNDKGEPATAAMIVLAAQGANIPASRRFKIANADQQGKYSLNGIPPGDYSLIAVEDLESGNVWDPEFLKTNDKYVEKLSIRENASETKTLKLAASSGQ